MFRKCGGGGGRGWWWWWWVVVVEGGDILDNCLKLNINSIENSMGKMMNSI